jgi:hypothetical protein
MYGVLVRRLRVCENRVLIRIFRPKKEGVTGEWRKIHNEDLNDLYSSPNIVRVINSRGMNGRGCSAYEEEERWGNMRVRDHLEDPGIDGRVILR